MDPMRVFAILALSWLLPQTASAADMDRSVLQARCWSPAQLSGAPQEKKALRGNRAFDTQPAITPLTQFEPVRQNLRGAIRRVKLPPGKKLIALTFDLWELTGEVAGYDAAVFDTLRATGVRATIFAGGKWMRSHPERTRQLMADPLFELANHGDAHRNLRLLKGPAPAQEINGAQQTYETARGTFAADQCVRGQEEAFASIPERISLFRFPFGACNQPALDAVNDAGLLAIQWDISTGDPFRGQSAQAITAAMLRAKPGAIIIAHGNGRGFHTAEALSVAIPALKAKGFKFVTVSELLAQGTPEISATCYNARPGDTDRYDTFFKPRLQKTARPPAETKNERGPNPR